VPDLNELAARVTALETQLAALTEKVSMESGLRAAVDTDLSGVNTKLSAANHLTQALSITQSDHTQELQRIHQKLDQHTATLEQHSATLDQHTAAFASVQTQLTTIVTLLQTLIDQDQAE
jgi:chromosome segregation ATPase